MDGGTDGLMAGQCENSIPSTNKVCGGGGGGGGGGGRCNYEFLDKFKEKVI